VTTRRSLKAKKKKKRRRKKKKKMMRSITLITRKKIYLTEGSQAVPVHPSSRGLRTLRTRFVT